MEIEMTKTKLKEIGNRGDYVTMEKLEFGKIVEVSVVRLGNSIQQGKPVKKFHDLMETGIGFTNPVISITKKDENVYLLKMNTYVSRIIKFHKKTETKNSKVFISQIVGSDKHGNKIFGKVQILDLYSSIKRNFPLKINGERFIDTIEEIIPQSKNLFILKTTTNFYYEVGIL